MPEIENKICCYTYRWQLSREDQAAGNWKADDCNGVLKATIISGYPEDGYYVEVCPRTSWLGRCATGINFCGNGADVIVLHRNTIPTLEEYQQAARDADNDW